MPEVLFSEIQSRIITEIDASTQNIRIAVAWFNNENLYNALPNKSDQITIELIIVNDENNNRQCRLDFKKLIDSGVKLFGRKQFSTDK